MNENKEKTTRAGTVQSVARALCLVDLIAASQDGMSLTQLANTIDLPKSTVFGLLATLREYQYVSQSPEDGRYLLGTRLFELGNRAARAWDVRDAAKPVLKRLAREFGETVHLGVEDNGEILYIEKISSDSLVNIVSEIGIRLPMHCSALGKVLLAQKSKAELRRITALRGLPAYTTQTITTLTQLDKALSRVREQGYAIDDGEIMENLRCVATPVRDANGIVKYAISMSGQVRDMYGKRLERIIEEMKKAAEEISASVANGRI